MTKFTIEKEVEIDDLPEEMLAHIIKNIVSEVNVGFSVDGKSLLKSYYGVNSQDFVIDIEVLEKIDILAAIDEMAEVGPKFSKALIITLEQAIEKLKAQVEYWEN